MYHFCDRAVEGLHRGDRVLWPWLDKAALCHCHQTVPQDRLDRVIVDAQIVQIGCAKALRSESDLSQKSSSYIPNRFSEKVAQRPPQKRGKMIEFCVQVKKSA